jgi:hypothetical protein
LTIALLAVVLVASVALAGGDLSRFSAVRVRWGWFLVAAAGTQAAILLTAPFLPAALLAGAHLASYAFAVAFLVANRTIPGLWLIGAGGLANLAAIGANGGVMPASPAALERAGLAQLEHFVNSAPLADPRLWFLGDIFAIPAGWPLANVFSVGDVLLLIGVAFGAHRVSGSRLVPRRIRRPAHDVLTVRRRELERAH